MGDKGIVLRKRYLVQEPLSFATTGGVYKALDQRTGDTVVLKEARPFTYFGGQEACKALEKEYFLLRKLEGTGIAPKPIELFHEWEHLFLAEEHIKGETLRLFLARLDTRLLLRTRVRDQDVDEFLEFFKLALAKLSRAIEILHDLGIIFCDLSPNNVIVTGESGRWDFKLIDFEAAYDPEWAEEYNDVFTPGFASPQRRSGKKPCYEDDYYSLGALAAFLLLPLNELFDWDTSIRDRILDDAAKEVGLPKGIIQAMRDLMSDRPEDRPHPRHLVTLVTSLDRKTLRKPHRKSKSIHELKGRIEREKDQLVRYILAVRGYREGELFPLDPRAYFTNTLSVAYGNLGVIYVLKKILGDLPHDLLSWVQAHVSCITPQEYPPGLYVGLSGIAWVLLELDLYDSAARVLRMTYDHPLLFKNLDLFHGLSGWGMTNLHFWLRTGDRIYYQKAIEAGDHIIRWAQDGAEPGFPQEDGDIYLGCALGASGVALFLLYLALVTGREPYLEEGQKFLAFDLEHLVEVEGILTAPISLKDRTKVPYWYHGSSGIATVALRYAQVLQEESYWEVAERVAEEDARRKYAISPSQFVGLSGLGEFLIDLYLFTGEERYLQWAYRVAEGVLLFGIPRPQGVAYPGRSLIRISCDFGTGGAGVAAFFHRLLHPFPRFFMLDEVIRPWSAG